MPSIKYRVTLQDLIDQELADALIGISHLFDMVAFVEALRDEGLVEFDEARQAFYLIPEASDPTEDAWHHFWGLVEDFDLEAFMREDGVW